MEILATSITPVQMLWGKILGLAGLGLVQVAVWGAAGAMLLSRGSSIWSGLANVSIPTPLLVWGPFYLLLGYLLFGALLAGIGAAVTSMQEGQQISGIVSLIAAVPVLLSVSFFSNANGTVPTILSMLPFTSPIAMVMRIPLADVPVWQIGLSLLLLVAGTLLIVWIAAQVFRLGLLMYGKRLGLRTLSAALRQGLDTVAESQAEQA